MNIKSGLEGYVNFVKQHGYIGDAVSSIAIDVVEEVASLSPVIRSRYLDSIFSGGQLVFPKENIFTRLLHNYTAFATQRRLYEQGIPFVLLPVKLE